MMTYIKPPDKNGQSETKIDYSQENETHVCFKKLIQKVRLKSKKYNSRWKKIQNGGSIFFFLFF